MQFRYFLLNASGTNTASYSSKTAASLSAVFYPSEVKLTARRTSNVTMQLEISPQASVGEYNSVLSAVNVQNASQVWGVIVQVNIAK